MPTEAETRRALSLLTGGAVHAAVLLLGDGAPAARRAILLAAVPSLIDYYGEGAATLAADSYEEAREEASVDSRFPVELVIADRGAKIGNAVAWASEPLFAGAVDVTKDRLAEVVQAEVARPFRDTMTTNSRLDPASVGWRRVSGNGCKFCRMLADRGAVYREDSAHFASHPACDCTAAPVFDGQDGPEASVVQYVASKRRRSPAQQQQLREYLAAMPD